MCIPGKNRGANYKNISKKKVLMQMQKIKDKSKKIKVRL